jgi:multidrug efflux pump
MIPLSSLVTIKRIQGADILERSNVFTASKVLGNPAPGFSSGQAIAAMKDVAHQVLSQGYQLAWTGSAYQEQTAGGTSRNAFNFGLILVFLILAAQYEHWSLPLAAVAAVPLAALGAALATLLRGLQNDLYFQVELIVLIGLAAKNAILAPLFVPLFYRLIEALSTKLSRRKAHGQGEVEHA